MESAELSRYQQPWFKDQGSYVAYEPTLLDLTLFQFTLSVQEMLSGLPCLLLTTIIRPGN